MPEPEGPVFVKASLPEDKVGVPEDSKPSQKEQSEQPTRPAVQSKPSALDSLKDKLLSALPSGAAGSASAAADESQKKIAQLAEKDVEIGIMGILHPTVLGSFDLEYPCSVFDFTLEGL